MDKMTLEQAKDIIGQAMELLEAQSENTDGLFHVQEYITTLATEKREAEAREREAMLALISLTPGGSEFIDDPKRCAEWVQNSLLNKAQAIIRFAKERNEAKEAECSATAAAAQMRGALEVIRRKDTSTAGVMGTCADIAHKVLATPTGASLLAVVEAAEVVTKKCLFFDVKLQLAQCDICKDRPICDALKQTREARG